MKYKYKKIVTTGANGTTITHRQNEDETIVTMGQIAGNTIIYSPTPLENQPEELTFTEAILSDEDLNILSSQRYIKNIEFNTNLQLQEIVKGYPQFEQDTFWIQEKEARAYKDDANAETLFLDKLCEKRGVAKDVLVDKIIINSVALKMETAEIIGNFRAVVGE